MERGNIQHSRALSSTPTGWQSAPVNHTETRHTQCHVSIICQLRLSQRPHTQRHVFVISLSTQLGQHHIHNRVTSILHVCQQPDHNKSLTLQLHRPGLHVSTSFCTWWYHSIPNGFHRHHWPRASILSTFSTQRFLTFRSHCLDYANLQEKWHCNARYQEISFLADRTNGRAIGMYSVASVCL